MLSEDYKDMLRCLSEENVDFLLVGGYAIAAYGFPRATKDGIDGVAFAAAYANRSMVQVDDLQIPVISVEDLIKNKRASGRPQDLADIEKLERLSPRA